MECCEGDCDGGGCGADMIPKYERVLFVSMGVLNVV